MIVLPPQQKRLNNAIWLLALAVAIIDLFFIVYTDVHFATDNLPLIILSLIVCVGISTTYRRFRPNIHLYLLGLLSLQLILITALLGSLSYLSAKANMPLVDGTLIYLDSLLFFDWRDYIHWMDAHPAIATVLKVAYGTSLHQIVVCAALLFLCSQTLQIQRFILAFFIAALFTIFIAMLFPAFGGYVHYNIDVTQFEHLKPFAARIHESLLAGMRDGTTKIIAFPLVGLVTFPSFHSAIAILLMYASLPVRWIAWIFIPLNILVLFSTPTDGGHYLTDVIGGIIVALVSIAIVHKLVLKDFKTTLTA